jgi:RND superfamily putative drug exporter
VGIFERLGAAVHRHRIAVIVAWAAILLPAAFIAPSIGSTLRAGGFTLPDLESVRARRTLGEELGVAGSALVVVLHSETMRAGTPEFEAAASEAVRDLPGAPYVAGYLSHLRSTRQTSPDGRTVYDIVTLTLDADRSPNALAGLQERLRQPPGLTAALAGGPAFYGDIQAVSESDLRRAELVSLPLAAVALVIVFGSLVAAGVPLAVGGGAVVVALAAIAIVASVVPMSIFVLNLATLLGLGLGVDYSLLMVSRYREELARRATVMAATEPPRRDEIVGEAIRVTIATAGRAVFFSGLTVLLGLSGLLLFEFMILRSVGIAGVIVVGLSVLAALTLLPAGLSLLGTRVDALAVRRLEAGPTGRGRWASLARWVMARPVAVLLPTLGLLVALGIPFLSVRLNAPDATILPSTVPSRAAYDLLVEQFGEGTFAPLEIAVRTTGPATEQGNILALHEWSRRLAADERIVRVDSLVDLDPRLSAEQYVLLYGRTGPPPDRYAATALAASTRDDLTVFSLTTPYGPNRDEARELVRELRDPSSALAPPPGVTILVGGGAADVEDVVSRMASDFPRTALYIVVTTYAVLFVLLRSIVLPAKALVMNSLSILASFGALVWIFQQGNLSAVLGFTPLGFVETTLPIILFCVLFGLSMDYEVFLLSRMREVWDRTHDNEEAVATGLERSGRIVTSAALIVVLVAGSFAFAEIVLIKAIGLGIAIAVALDATIVRALLVPATMRLLGDWNWWLPASLERWARVHLPGVEGSPAEVAEP